MMSEGRFSCEQQVLRYCVTKLNWIFYFIDQFSEVKFLGDMLSKLCVRLQTKQAGNGPSRRPAQGSKKVKCFKYAKRHF